VPKEYPIPNEHLVYEPDSGTIDIDNVPLDGGVLARTIYLSLDPYLRGRMRDPSIQSYASTIPLGTPMQSRTIVKVIRSEDVDFQLGDYILVTRGADWSLYSVLTKSKNGLVKVQKPGNLPLSVYGGVLGMPGQTAFLSLRAFAKMKAGETLFVSTAAGVVGSAVAQLAKLAGLKVIGSTGDDDKVKWLEELKLDVAFNYKTTKVADVLREHGPIDIYFDNVGGETLDVALEHIKQFGRIILCGAISQYNRGDKPAYGIKNLSLAIGKSLSINGFIVSSLATAEEQKVFYKEYQPLVEQGKIKFQETRTQGLEKAADALLGMFKGENKGKTIVVVSEE
jgi:hypothetical protein